MAKRIILPIGLPSAYVDIGTLTAVFGVERTYDATSVSLSAAIKSVIGDSGDAKLKRLSNLIGVKPGINQNAAFKPTAIAHPSGMQIESNYLIWAYPTDSDGYRMGDFLGYNHDAPRPGVIWTRDVVMKATGNSYIGLCTVTLPEYDVRDFNSGVRYITHANVKVMTGATYDTLENEYPVEILDVDCQYRIIGLPYYVYCATGADKNYKLIFELGWWDDTPGDEHFEFLCHWAGRTSSALSKEMTAIYDPDPVLRMNSIDPDEVTPSPVYEQYYVDFTPIYVVASGSDVNYSFSYRVMDANPDPNLQVETGDGELWARNPETETWFYVRDLTFPSSGSNTITGTFAGADLDAEDLTDDVYLEIKNIDLSPPT